jgi:cytoskeleton protein RodZ
MTPQETFVTRLRRYRQRHRIAIEEIAADMRIKPELLEALERNDLSEWPRGLYARAWIRAYASAVGLDPVDTVDEFCRLFPHGDRRARPTLHEMAAIVAHDPQYHDDVRPDQDRRRSPQVNVLPKATWSAVLSGAVRVAWQRVQGGAAAPSARLKRTPRTTS